MSSINEIWASMNESSAVGTTTKNTKVVKKSKKTKDLQVKVLLNNNHTTTDLSLNIDSNNDNKMTKNLVDYTTMTSKLSRDIIAISENDILIRKKSLQQIYNTLFVVNDMTDEGYSEVFRDICKLIFKRFEDTIEKCRELAQKITLTFFQKCSDLVPILGYYFPALIKRLPSGMVYDEEMKVFVSNIEEHEAYRRGRAVDRQDKAISNNGGVYLVIEPSEEIRYITCNSLYHLIKRVKDINAAPILHPYFQEILLFVQTQLLDPYPELKLLACNTLELLARTLDYEPGMKFFAVGLVRSILPVLRNRLSKVRIAAIAAMHACMVVVDHAKRKAAGSEAIIDLVGFREENVLPIVAFYKADVQVNYLAELVIDKSPAVREELAKFLQVLLNDIGDRYDHHTRLLPYVLDLLTDDNESIANIALVCLQRCGKEYELEHDDEIRDRLQYGVDGDKRINLDKPLPFPFKERPKIGMRLYVRGNSKRFLNALVGELTNWISTTRYKSVQLLKMLVILCEEHLTVETHTLLPSFIKALKFAKDDKDNDLYIQLIQLFELLGRYILPEVYIYYILPRLRGDADVVPFGTDTETRIIVIEFLQALLLGSKTGIVIQHFDELIDTLTDTFIIPLDSPKLQAITIDTLLTLFQAIKGKSNAIIESYFITTGRLTSLQNTIKKVFKFLLLQLSNPTLSTKAFTALNALSELESDSNTNQQGMHRLYDLYTRSLLLEALDNYETILSDCSWSIDIPEHVLLANFIHYSCRNICNSIDLLQQVLDFFTNTCSIHTNGTNIITNGTNSNSDIVQFDQLLLSLSELLLVIIKYINKEQSYSCIVNQSNELVHDTTTTTTTRTTTTIETCIPSYKLLVDSFANIVNTFVFSSYWNRNILLQEQKLKFIAICTNLSLDLLVTDQSTNETSTKRNLSEEILLLENNNNIFKSYTDYSMILNDINLVNHLEPLLESILSNSLHPSNPLSLRLNALVIVSHLIQYIHLYLNHMKLKSFQYWNAIYNYSEYYNNFDNNNIQQILKILVCKLSIQNSIPYLLLGLNDTENSIRNLTLGIISSMIIFIISDNERLFLKQYLINNRNNNNNNNNNVFDQIIHRICLDKDILLLGVSYKGLIVSLLKHLTNNTIFNTTTNNNIALKTTIITTTNNDNQSFLEYMNDTLRLLCVLDPIQCEVILREELDHMLQWFQSIHISETNGHEEIAVYSQGLNEFVSGLLNHIDVLKQFS